MKGLAIYWLIGCILIGSAIGTHASRCPSDTTPPLANLVAGIAIWPALLIAAIGMTPAKTCESATTDASPKGDGNG